MFCFIVFIAFMLFLFYYYVVVFFCTFHWADLSWLTFHYLLYPVWLCMWQIIKNLEPFCPYNYSWWVPVDQQKNQNILFCVKDFWSNMIISKWRKYTFFVRIITVFYLLWTEQLRTHQFQSSFPITSELKWYATSSLKVFDPHRCRDLLCQYSMSSNDQANCKVLPFPSSAVWFNSFWQV